MPSVYKFRKNLCCFDLTLAARLIGFMGLAISILLTTVLISDKFGDNFNNSRRTALALGLDWQHFHVYANATHHADPEGKLISVIVIFYAVLYLLTSSLLIYATIAFKRWFTVPWLICELFGSVSKTTAMIYHATNNCEHFSNVFVVGSICYIVLMIWWWIVVFAAQTTWTFQNNFAFHFSMTPKPSVSMDSRMEDSQCTISSNIKPKLLQADEALDSPIQQQYVPNQQYSEI